MPAFEYTALDTAGKRAKGFLNADSEVAARRELRRRNLAPLKVGRADEKAASRPGASASLLPARGLSRRDLMVFTRQFASLVEAGIPVEEALGLLSQQAEKPALRRVLSSVRSRVQEGSRLAESLSDHPASFPAVYRAMISAGESAGGLARVLNRLADYLEKADVVRRNIQAALVYPAALAVTAIFVVCALLVFIVPRIAEQFDGTGVSLPLPTQILIGLSGFLQAYGLYLLVALAAMVLLGTVALRSDAAKLQCDRLMRRLPLMGGWSRDMEAARFARTVAILIQSGAVLPDALRAAGRAAGNRAFALAIEDVVKNVETGTGLSEALRRQDWFPGLLVHMVAAGERSGALGDMFERAALQLEQDVDGRTSMALNLLEPAIIIIMGAIVTGIILSILLPILRLNTLALG
ncbi:type II secretion system inner membrane protein GspF [Hyphobacterium sp.]|uniref:type II secretion system inner membrane protein GspF n=1 Tax=Hyphobacterium sp. TaxID=2004662 RepID=UPI003BA904CD